MMKDWLLPTISIPIVWGFYGFLPKLAVRYINPLSAMVFQVIGYIVFGFIILIYIDFRPEIQFKGMVFSFFAGIFGIAGAFLYLIAVSRGKVSIIVLISGLYPVITILLSYILLKEQITIKEGIGMVFALISIILFSI